MSTGRSIREPWHEAIAASDQQLVQLTDLALASAAQRSGLHLVCKPGCTQCCHGAFAINALDAWRLRQGMQELATRDPERAHAVRERASRYVREYAATFPGDPLTGILGTSEEEQETFEEFANDDACPALDPATGLCDLYTARPMTCRLFGPPVRSMAVKPEATFLERSEPEENEDQEGFAVCELCFTEATEDEIVAAEMHPPRAEEQALLTRLTKAAGGPGESTLKEDDETIIAWCLADLGTISTPND